MQFQVPQNIDLEDKIVGPLTLKNFLILLFGGMFIYLLFFIPMPRAITIIIAIPLGIILLAISFIKVQDQSFPRFFLSLIYYMLRPKKRLWNQNAIKPEVKIKNKTQKEAIAHPDKQNLSAQQIAKLAAIVDTKGWRPVTSETVNGEEINLENRIKSAPETKLPQSKIESKNAVDVLEVPLK